MRISLSDVSLQQAPVDILVVGVRSTNPKKDALLDKVEKAAGGTLIAPLKLIERLGASVAQVQVVIEMSDLDGRENLAAFGVHDLYAMIRTS